VPEPRNDRTLEDHTMLTDSLEAVLRQAAALGKTEYGTYLKNLIDDDRAGGFGVPGQRATD